MKFTLNLFLIVLLLGNVTPFAQDGVVSKPAAKPAVPPASQARKKPRRRTLRQSPKPIYVLVPAPSPAPTPSAAVAAPATSAAAQTGAAGIELFNKKNYAAAEAAFRQALAVEPKNTLHNYYLGAALMWQLKYSEGETYLRKAIALEPNNATLRKDLATDLYFQQKFPQAEEELRTAVQLEPRVAAYRVQLGNLLYHLQKYSESEKSYLEAVRLEPDNAAYQKALAIVQAALKTTPGNVSTDSALHNNMGRVLFDQHKYAEAEKEFREALRLQPGSVEYTSNLAKAMLERQKAESEGSHGAGALTSTVSKPKDVWLVCTIVNKTPGPMFYQLLLAGKWKEFALPTGHQTIHTEAYEEPLYINFDYKYEPGTQAKQMQVAVTKVSGHEPTEADKLKAKTSSFTLDSKGEIQLTEKP